MKQGWTYKKLGEVCEKAKNIRWEDYDDQRIFSYIDLTSVDRNSLSIKNPQSISKLNAPSRAKQIIKEGDVLFATTRPTLRRVCIIPTIFDSQICSTGFCVLRPKHEINAKWIYYALQNDNFYKYIEPLQTGASYPAVTDSIVKNYNLSIPPLSEQQRIVERLDSAFAHIDELKANAEKQVNEARALFQKALSKAMEPKEGWEEKTLGGCFVSINNGANIKQIKGAKGIPITRIETLSNDKFNRERMGYANVFDSSLYSSYILNDGDILMSHINSMKFLGRAVQYTKIENEIILHGMNLLRLVPTKEVLSSFLIYQFYTAFFRNQIISISHQSVNQASFNTTNLKGLYLLVPPLSEQQRIVERLDSLSENVKALEENQRKVMAECDALKQALLRKVFE